MTDNREQAVDDLRDAIVAAAVDLRRTTRARYHAKVNRAKLRKEYREEHGDEYVPGHSDNGAHIDDAQYEYDRASDACKSARQRLHRFASQMEARIAPREDAQP